MVVWKFLKEQNWKYVLLCLFFLSCFTGRIELLPSEYHLAWLFISATGFLICYSLKFAGKQNNLLIDQLKLVVYFLYFTAYLLLLNDRYNRAIIEFLFPMILFYLYFYTILNYYITEMEAKNKSIRKSFLYLITVINIICSIGIAIWAITQKVEAEKQKVVALKEKEKAVKAIQLAETAKTEAKKAMQLAEREHERALIAEMEVEKAKAITEELLKKKR